MSRALLERATAYADTVIADLTYDDLQLATPCDGWDVGRVVLHLADVADGLVNLLETGQLALPEPARTDDPEPVCVLRACLNRLDARLSTAARRTEGQIMGQPHVHVEITGPIWRPSAAPVRGIPRDGAE